MMIFKPSKRNTIKKFPFVAIIFSLFCLVLSDRAAGQGPCYFDILDPPHCVDYGLGTACPSGLCTTHIENGIDLEVPA